MDTAKSPLAVVAALYRALEAGQHGAELAGLFTEDALTIEHPNAIKPKGARVRRSENLAASTAGARLLSWQRYDVHSAIEHGTTAIVRLSWTGSIARAARPFRAGQVLTAHIAQFIEVREGRVAAIETYDCYEPFD